MDATNRRIVLLGKTGAGKSSLANTIFGEKLFKVDHSANSETKACQAETKSVNGRKITLIDTPGLFDTDRSEEEMKPEIVKCIIESSPGPHAFLILFKVERFTEQEQAVVQKIHNYFSEEVFRYSTVVFNQGDQLPEGQKIEDHFQQNKPLSDLVRKCGGRCRVIDNKYWNQDTEDEYRSNRFQVEKLLNTIEETLQANNGRYYTNKMLQAVEEEIQQEEDHIRLLHKDLSEEEIREQAKARVFKKFWIHLAGYGTGILLGAFLGLAANVKLVFVLIKQMGQSVLHAAKKAGAALRDWGAKAAGQAAAGEETTEEEAAAAQAGISFAEAYAQTGAVRGGIRGLNAAEGANTVGEAVRRAAEAVTKDATLFFQRANDVFDKQSQPKYKSS